MNYGKALEALQDGYRVARKGWNGKDMWLILVPGRILESIQPDSFYDKCGFKKGTEILSHIDMKTADGKMLIGWTPNQVDQLANDWQIITS
jgi:hypothetical protein